MNRATYFCIDTVDGWQASDAFATRAEADEALAAWDEEERVAFGAHVVEHEDGSAPEES
jgi:hypothetical protein